MAGKMAGSDVQCSFCGKTQDQVKKLIAGKMLNRAFKMEVSQEVYENLAKELNFN